MLKLLVRASTSKNQLYTQWYAALRCACQRTTLVSYGELQEKRSKMIQTTSNDIQSHRTCHTLVQMLATLTGPTCKATLFRDSHQLLQQTTPADTAVTKPMTNITAVLCVAAP